MKKAFTVIELIISLIIFGMGLLLTLTVLNKNIILGKKVQLTTQSTLLAKEGIEIVFNIRDSNNIKYRPWNYITGNYITSNDYKKFEAGKSYIISTELSGENNMMKEIINPTFNNTRLYLKTGEILDSTNKTVYSGFYYSYNTGKNTPFSRYVTFTGVYLAPENKIENTNILKLNSIVKYKMGFITGEIILESFITNWK